MFGEFAITALLQSKRREVETLFLHIHMEAEDK